MPPTYSEVRSHMLGCDEYHQHLAPKCCDVLCWCQPPVRRTVEVSLGSITAVYAEVWVERERQRSQWGDTHDDTHNANDWVAYITRYLGEATYSYLWKDPGQFLKADFRTAMVKIAAIAIAAVEFIDRKSA